MPFLVTGCKKEKRVPVNVDHIFLDNKCTNYFFNLGYNYPTNAKGSCGYVGSLALLRYYDYIENDNIIDPQYEEGTGLKKMNFSYASSLDNLAYYNYLEATKDLFIQSLLITKANEKYHLYNPNVKEPCITYSSSSCRVESYYSEVGAMIDMYLYEIKAFSLEEISVNRISNDMRNEIINKVKEGTPILLSTKWHNKYGHTFICYDYDEVEDQLYGNLLMEENYNHVLISSIYDTMNTPLYLKINRKK